MNNKILILFFYLFITSMSFSQKVYDEKADVNKQLDEAIIKAKTENKHVFAMVGGNWCKWCLIFNELLITNDTVSKVLNNNYVLVHINYVKGDSNEQILQRLGYPRRFGFPVFVIYDENGNRIHTQNSSYLEKGNGYDPVEVEKFLNHWNKKALTSIK